MKITNKVTDEDYIQWIEDFVAKVLKHARIKYNKAVIDDIEPSRRIFILIDNKEYDIRTWDYRVIKYDNNNIPCAENVEYTLFEIVQDDDGSHGEIVDEGRIRIEWVN